MTRLFLISEDSPLRQILLPIGAAETAGHRIIESDEGRVLTQSPMDTAQRIIGQAYAAVQCVNAACSALIFTKFDPHPQPGVDPVWYRNIEGLFYSAHILSTFWLDKLSYEMLYATPVRVLLCKRIFVEGADQILSVLEPYEMQGYISKGDYVQILHELEKMCEKIRKNQQDCEAVLPKLLQWFGQDQTHGMRNIARQLHSLVDEQQLPNETVADISDAIATIKTGAALSYEAAALPANVEAYRTALHRLTQTLEAGASAATALHIIDVVIQGIVCNVDAVVSKMTDVGVVWNAFGNQIQSVINTLKEVAGENQTVLEYLAETFMLQRDWGNLAAYAENLLESRS